MNVAIIGTGARAALYTQLCLSNIRDDVFINALVDINSEKLLQFAAAYFDKNKRPALYTDFNKMLEDHRTEAIFICTPDTTHHDIAIAALKKGKHVLLEKPIATTLEDCIAVYRESLKHDKVVVRMGFVLRYTEIYGKIKTIVSNGRLGRLITIEAKETLGYKHGGSFFRRWHRFGKNNGGFLNAKCSHDMDLINWIVGDEPKFVSAFGSRSYFNYRKEAAAKCSECRIKDSCRYCYTKEDFDNFGSVEDICVFNSDKDIVDHEVVSIQYNNGITASFSVSTVSAEANRTMVIFGTEATLYADFSKGVIEVKYIFPQNKVTYEFERENTGHGGGDTGIYKNFIDSIRTNEHTYINDVRAGLMSSGIALAAEISMEEKKVVNLQEWINHSL